MKTLALIIIAASLITSNYIELRKIEAIQRCIHGNKNNQQEYGVRL